MQVHTAQSIYFINRDQPDHFWKHLIIFWMVLCSVHLRTPWNNTGEGLVFYQASLPCLTLFLGCYASLVRAGSIHPVQLNKPRQSISTHQLGFLALKLNKICPDLPYATYYFDCLSKRSLIAHPVFSLAGNFLKKHSFSIFTPVNGEIKKSTMMN